MEVIEKISCHHCGEDCPDAAINSGDKIFCCDGCKLVFELLDENGLCEYYQLESHPGARMAAVEGGAYDYLDEPAVRDTLVTFHSEDFSRARFHVPSIHCSSCIWLLENFRRLDKGVVRSEVNFGRREVTIDFNPRHTSLARVAERMSSIGYAPEIRAENAKPETGNGRLLIRLGIAGFVFGNVMLFSFPEYLGIDAADHTLSRLFSWLNLLLSIPVLVFSADEYFRSAIKTFSARQINIDVPIALGLLALFGRSTYDIISATGPGYLDSFTGLVFFLLIGRWLQGRTYERLSFDRDFKSYFPLAVQRSSNGQWQSTLIAHLRTGDLIRIRNLEIVPCDATLQEGEAFIDYSFVTGEARPVKVVAGDVIYAGGRLLGKPVVFETIKEVSNSQLTSLWNQESFRKKYESRYKKIIDRAARTFTWIVLAITLVTAVYWNFADPGEMWLVITALLMVACPCALALAAPFTYGTMLNAFGRHGFFLKNADVVERLASIDTVVFDKTGTITHGDKPSVEFHGTLREEEMKWLKALASASTHPLSVLVAASIPGLANVDMNSFREYPGKGVEGTIDGHEIRLGSAEFAAVRPLQAVGRLPEAEHSATRVFVSIDGAERGHFTIQTSLRRDIGGMLRQLGTQCVAMLSGDNESDAGRMREVFPESTSLLFNQSPGDKMSVIAGLQSDGRRVLMVGDGLNDAGALKQADVGIAVTDQAGMFAPGCDAILQGNQLRQLDKLLLLARKSSRTLKGAFVISFLYNAIALSFAVTGNLSPLVAAVLMPLSSISVVTFASVRVNLAVRQTLETPVGKMKKV